MEIPLIFVEFVRFSFDLSIMLTQLVYVRSFQRIMPPVLANHS